MLFLPAAFLLERRDDLRGVLRRLTGVHGDVAFHPIFLVIVGSRHGHIQLQRLEGRRQDGEAVCSQKQIQTAAIIPAHQETIRIVNTLQRSHCARFDRTRFVFHLMQFDSAPYRELLAKKVQPFFRYCLFHFQIPHFYIDLCAFRRGPALYF